MYGLQSTAFSMIKIPGRIFTENVASMSVAWDSEKITNRPTEDELAYHRTWAMILAVESGLWNLAEQKGKKRTEVTCSNLKKGLDQDGFDSLRDALMNPANIYDVHKGHFRPRVAFRGVPQELWIRI